MEPGQPPLRFTRPGRLPLAALGIAAACLLLLSSPAPSRADIYRWEDVEGTVHFTDDVSTIPPRYRKDSTRLIREAPSVISPERASPSPMGKQAPLPGAAATGRSAEEEAAQEAAREKEELVSQVEQQKAKIAAKEQHIRAVDAKRSLAVNPLRNRFVDQADLDLYEKYQAELPADRERLQGLESRIESIK